MFTAVLTIVTALALSISAQKGKNATTLAGYKTIDICEVSPATDEAAAIWRYSGFIAVWNEGAIATTGLAITDVLENKTGNTWLQAGSQAIVVNQQIAAGTTLLTATLFPYSFEGAALPGIIRNTANITITNHSGQGSTPFGPSPKATYSGPLQPAPCTLDDEGGCSYSQGYWGNKPDVVWPAPYSRDAQFFLSGLTWQQVLDTSGGGNGYFILAKQYIATVLNKANGAEISSGTQDTLDLATAWYNATTGTAAVACPANSSCGLQKDWGATLDGYIQANHCDDE